MSIKGAQIISIGGTQIIHRLQSVRATVDRARDIIRELGNYQTVGDSYDNPVVTYEVESYDVSARFEFLVARKAESESEYNSASGYVTLNDMFKKLTIISPIKDANESQTAPVFVCIPGVELTDFRYTFGGNDNASQTFTFRGSEQYVCPGKFEYFTATGNGTQKNFSKTLNGNPVYTSENKAIVYVEVDSVKMIPDVDYTESYDSENGTITLTFVQAPKSGASIRWVVATDAPETFSQNIHLSGTTLPGAIKGKDVLLFVKTQSMSDFEKMPEITSLEISATAGTSETYFLGSDVVRIDREIPEITGTIRFKPDVPNNFYSFVRKYILDKSTDTVVSASDLGPTCEILVKLRHPVTKEVLKSLYLPTVRISIPGFSGGVTDTVEPELSLTSLDADIRIYKGDASV